MGLMMSVIVLEVSGLVTMWLSNSVWWERDMIYSFLVMWLLVMVLELSNWSLRV